MSKKFKADQDPNLVREAEKYERPVPSREYILNVLSEAGQPLFLEDFLDIFGIDDDAGKEGVRRRLRAMSRDGELFSKRDGAYRLFIKGKDQAPPPRPLSPMARPEFINQTMAIENALRHHQLPHEWSEDVLAEAARFDLDIPAAEIKKRHDLRHLAFVTIDGEDAKDFDDAVYCEPLPQGQYRLLVAIADVSFYVREGTALNAEALNRGNSIYFPGKVIPMLPEVLSNELCSLKPNVDRLCMVAEMLISAEGELLSYGFYPGVLRSKARLTYNQVAAVLNTGTCPQDELAPIWPHVFDLYALYRVLFAAREVRGALDFDTIESVLILNDKGELEAIKPVVRNEAHRLIEEMMLMANVAAAHFFEAKEALGIFRIHEGVRPEKFADLCDFLKIRGIQIGHTQPSAKALNALLSRAAEREDYSIIQTVVLRSLNQAIYSPHNKGHYGLSFEAYTHFTSPIRRYPDLLVHRLIRSLLDPKDRSAATYTETELDERCVHTSHTERRADEASREVATTLKCGLIKQHLGAEFMGIISGVTAFGLFVTLNDLLIDGLIHISTLPKDFYTFDPAHHRLVGERSGRVFQLGQAVSIRVVKVNIWDRKIDFMLL